MKYLLFVLTMLLLAVTLRAQDNTAIKNYMEGKKMPKVLVVYYSLSGNTERAAKDIALKLNADLEQVIDKKNRKGFIAYIKACRDAMKEYVTDIETTNKDPKNYDVIVIGTPVWAWNMAPAIRTYMTNNKNSMNKVAFFETSGNTKPEGIIEKMEKIIAKKCISFAGFNKNELKNKVIYDNKIKSFADSILLNK